MNTPKDTLNEIEFFSDFLLVPLFIAVMMHYNTDPLWQAIAILLLGTVSWTLYEYLMHRFLFHRHHWFLEQHDDHHRFPKALIGNKPWMTAAATVTVWTLIFLGFDENTASAYTSGMLFGYLFYCGIHINIHHGDPQTFHRPLARLFAHHAAHHRGGTTNFGVSTIWWDRIFGTYSAS